MEGVFPIMAVRISELIGGPRGIAWDTNIEHLAFGFADLE